MERPKKEDERSRLLEQGRSRDGWPLTIFFMFTTICLSVGVINFNRYLMVGHRFPFPAALVFIHMVFCSSTSAVLRMLVPSWFPSLTDANQHLELNRDFFTRGVLPIAVCFACSLILANAAYGHLSLAFLQMLKETGVITAYVFALMAGLEYYSLRHVQIIAIAILGATLSIKGELHFHLVGFIIQMGSQFADCGRLVLQSLVLSGRSKLDAMSYMLLISPACAVVLGVVCSGVHLFTTTVPQGLVWPKSETVVAWAPVLAANCVIAFLLNLSATTLIMRAGPMLYMFTGVLKDIVALLVSVYLVHDSITHLQGVAFVIQIAAVVAWGAFKHDPAKFEHGLLAGSSHLVLGLFRGPAAEVALARQPCDAEAAWDASSKGGQQLTAEARKVA